MNSQKPATINLLKDISLPKAIGVILLISAAAFGFLIWLIYFKGGSNYSSELIDSLPALNALLNSASAVFLLFGYKAILDRKFSRHMKFNLTAFITSTLFLTSYVIYHNFAASTHFPGQGVAKYIYFFILISHIILSALVVPLILSSFYLAFSGKLKLHRKVSKITLPIWLYVSVTGVVVFFMLRVYI